MSDIRCIPVKDSVIADIRSEIDFAVQSGASQNTYQRFPSTSTSNSSMIFNVQCPSEDIIIDRALMLSSGLSLKITIDSGTSVIPKGTLVFNYGVTDCLAAFPLNSLFTTSTCSINNTTLSTTLQDILPQLLKMNSVHSITKYNTMTPAMPDAYWGSFADGAATNSNVLSTLNNAGLDYRYMPRGVHPVNIQVASHDIPGVGTTAASSDKSLYAAGVAGEKWVIILDTNVTEPLIGLNPWVFGDADYNNQGIYGVNNMSFQFNIDSGCRRVFSSATGYITKIELNTLPSGHAFGNQNKSGFSVAQTQPALLFRFLASQPTDLISTKNVLPLLQFPRYLTSSANNGSAIAGASRDALTGVISSTSVDVTSNSLQLAQVPDKFIICVRYPMNSQTWNNTSSFLTINSCSITFSNAQGLLSGASQQDLWRISKRNGSQISWEEFSGTANINGKSTTSAGVTTFYPNPYVSTIGSLLVLNPAYDLSLPSYISNGSIGQYLFQIKLNVTNQFTTPVTPEICILTVNSGVLTVQSGTAAAYGGLLTKELVLAANSEHPATHVTSNELNRKIGGNLGNAALSAMGGMIKHTHKRYAGGASSGGNRLSKHI